MTQNAEVNRFGSSTNVNQGGFDSRAEALYQISQQNTQSSFSSDTGTNAPGIDSIRLNVIDFEIKNLHSKITMLEVEKKALKDYIKKSHGLNKMLFFIISLVPVGFMFALYFVIKDHLSFLPDIVKNSIVGFITILGGFEVFKIALYIPNELKYIKKDIEELKNQHE